jgi:hypothetical protein
MECEYCKKIFSSRSNLRYHQTRARYCLDIQNVEPSILYTCEHCQKEFTVKDNYETHVVKHMLNPVFQAQERVRIQAEEHAKELERVHTKYTNKIKEHEQKIQKHEEKPETKKKVVKKAKKQIAKKIPLVATEEKIDEPPTIVSEEIIHVIETSEEIEEKYPPVNPVDKLNIANLTEKDFEGCRITPEGKFSVYDVIAKFKGCSSRDAIKVFSRLADNYQMVGGQFVHQLNEHQFRRKNGALGPPIPVCTFSELLPILSQLPGEQAKILRREQAENNYKSNCWRQGLERIC